MKVSSGMNDEGTRDKVAAIRLQATPAGGVYYHGGPEIPGNVLKQGRSGAIFLTKSRAYAQQYIKPGGCLYAVDLDFASKRIFDPENDDDLRQLKQGFLAMVGDLDNGYETREDALSDYRQYAGQDLLDWSIGSQVMEAAEAGGFHGMRMRERPGTIGIAKDGDGFTVSGAPIESVAMFDREIPVRRIKPKWKRAKLPAIEESEQTQRIGLSKFKAMVLAEDPFDDQDLTVMGKLNACVAPISAILLKGAPEVRIGPDRRMVPALSLAGYLKGGQYIPQTNAIEIHVRRGFGFAVKHHLRGAKGNFQWNEFVQQWLSMVTHEVTHQEQFTRMFDSKSEAERAELLQQADTAYAHPEHKGMDAYLLQPIEIAAYARGAVSEWRNHRYTRKRIEDALKDPSQWGMMQSASPSFSNYFHLSQEPHAPKDLMRRFIEQVDRALRASEPEKAAGLLTREAKLPEIEYGEEVQRQQLEDMKRTIAQELEEGWVTDETLGEVIGAATGHRVHVNIKGEPAVPGEALGKLIDAAHFEAGDSRSPIEMDLRPGSGLVLSNAVRANDEKAWKSFADSYIDTMVHEDTHRYQFNRMRTRKYKEDPSGKAYQQHLENFAGNYNSKEYVSYLSNEVEIAAHARQAVQQLRANGQSDSSIHVIMRATSLYPMAAKISLAFKKYYRFRQVNKQKGVPIFREFLKNMSRALPPEKGKPISREDYELSEVLSPSKFRQSKADKKADTEVAWYHGSNSETEFETLQKNAQGIVWLADRASANRYARIHYRRGESRLFEVYLKSNARVIDLRDLANPVVREFKDIVNQDRKMGMGPIADESWPGWADFGMLEHYEWAVKWFRSKRVDGLLLKDAAGAFDHESLALLNPRAIGSQKIVPAAPAKSANKADKKADTATAEAPVKADGPGSSNDAKAAISAVTETPAFKAWFAGSQVVNADGSPKVVYHGTNADFDVFDGDNGQRTDPNPKHNFPGVQWFGGKPEAATYFAGRGEGARSVPVYLALKNPRIVNVARLDEASGGGFRLPEGDVFDIAYIKARQLDEAKADGNDSVIFENAYDGSPATGTIYAVFNAAAIKSAIGNNGGFDPSNPSITAKLLTRQAEELEAWMRFPEAEIADGSIVLVKSTDEARNKATVTNRHGREEQQVRLDRVFYTPKKEGISRDLVKKVGATPRRQSIGDVGYFLIDAKLRAQFQAILNFPVLADPNLLREKKALGICIPYKSSRTCAIVLDTTADAQIFYHEMVHADRYAKGRAWDNIDGMEDNAEKGQEYYAQRTDRLFDKPTRRTKIPEGVTARLLTRDAALPALSAGDSLPALLALYPKVHGSKDFDEVEELLGQALPRPIYVKNVTYGDRVFPGATFYMSSQLIYIYAQIGQLTQMNESEWDKAMRRLIAMADHELTHKHQTEAHKTDNRDHYWDHTDKDPYTLAWSKGRLTDKSRDEYHSHPLETAAWGREIVSELRIHGWADERIKSMLRTKAQQAEAAKDSEAMAHLIEIEVPEQPYFRDILAQAAKALETSKSAAVNTTMRTLYHGTATPFDQLQPNQYGIIWLGDKRTARTYADMDELFRSQVDRERHERTLAVKLSKDANIVRLDDLSNPVVAEYRKMVSKIFDTNKATGRRTFAKPEGDPAELIADAEWVQQSTHGMIERYSDWAIPFFVEHGVDGLLVSDDTGKKKGAHESVAILNPNVITSEKRASKLLTREATDPNRPGFLFPEIEPDLQGNWYPPGHVEPEPEKDERTLEEKLDDAEGDEAAIQQLLTQAGAWAALEYSGGVLYRTEDAVIDVSDASTTYYKDPQQFISQCNVEEFLPNYEDEFNRQFWEDPQELYHATDEDNLAAIMKNGLNASNETRGMSNRGVASAVFTTDDIEYAQAGHYGDAILAIDMAAFKASTKANKLPYVGREPDVVEGESRESLAHALEVTDFNHDYEDGMDRTTVIVHGSIPPQFLHVEQGEYEKQAAKRAAGKSALDQLPIEDVLRQPGTAPLAPGMVRLFHYTSGGTVEETRARLDSIVRNGILQQKAVGQSYGEPSMVWASTVMPNLSTNYFVEIAVRPEQIVSGRPGRGAMTEDEIADFQQGSSDVRLSGDVTPEQIIGVHEPWHGAYQYLAENPETIAGIRAGEYADFFNPTSPWFKSDDGIAMQRWVKEHPEDAPPQPGGTKQAAAEQIDYKPILAELIEVLTPGLPVPTIEIVNRKEKWLGMDHWAIRRNADRTSSCDDNTLIYLQKIAMIDEPTLRRVLAHELAHHEDNLLNVKPEFLRMGFDTFRMMQRFDSSRGHGKGWLAIAARFNAKYGEGFVTPKSDESYVLDNSEVKPYFVFMQHYPGKFYVQHATRLSPKMKIYLQARANKQPGDYQYRLFMTTDPMYMQKSPTIGNGGWGYVKTDEEKAKLEKLWNEGEDILAQYKPEPEPSKTAAKHLPWEGEGRNGPFPGSDMGGRLSKIRQVRITEIEETEGSHSAEVIESIKQSLRGELDEAVPAIIVGEQAGKPPYFLIDGHHRLKAARQLGYKQVPVRIYREPGDGEPLPDTDTDIWVLKWTTDQVGQKTSSEFNSAADAEQWAEQSEKLNPGFINDATITGPDGIAKPFHVKTARLLTRTADNSTRTQRYESRPGEGEYAGYEISYDNAGEKQTLRELRYKADCEVSDEYVLISRIETTQSSRERERARVEEIKQGLDEKWVEAVLIEATDGGKRLRLSDGHHRMEACKQKGFKTIPAIVISVDYGFRDDMRKWASVLPDGLLDWSTPVEGATVSLTSLDKGDPQSAKMLRECRVANLKLDTPASDDKQVRVHWTGPEQFRREVVEWGDKDHVRVNEIADQMKQGAKFAPAVFFDGTWVDGNHRVDAAKKLGLKQVPVVDLKDFLGFGDDPKPSKPLTEKERREVDEMFAELDEQGKTAKLLTRDASPDFGYTQYNDKEKDLKKIRIVPHELGAHVLEVAALAPGQRDATDDGCPGYITAEAYQEYGEVIAFAVNRSDIRPEWRGTGLGQMLYDGMIREAMRKGATYLYSDETRSPDAEKAWKRLAQRYDVVPDAVDNRYRLTLPNAKAKAASPDFGYSQYNDREKDLAQVEFTVSRGDDAAIDVNCYSGGVDDAHRIGGGLARVSRVNRKKAYRISTIRIADEWKGTGLGQKVYEAIIVEARKRKAAYLISDDQMSRDAEMAWSRLSQRYPVEWRSDDRAILSLTPVAKQRTAGAYSSILKDPALKTFVEQTEAKGITLSIMESRFDYWTLSKIVVPEEQQGTGIGSVVMEGLCRLADQQGKTIFLSPSKDFGASSVSRLATFYKRFGFKPNKGRNKDFRAMEAMVREPKQTKQAAVNVDDANFRTWFGDSKIVDDSRKPLVCYHGADAVRTVFAPEKGKRYTMGQEYEVPVSASFFTSDKKFALTFGPKVTPVYLRMQKPLDLREGAWGFNDDKAYEVLKNHFGEQVGFTPPEELWDILDQIEHTQSIRDLGYDGLIFVERGKDGEMRDTYAVFSSTQIKSAVRNSGKFEVDEQRITAKQAAVNVDDTSFKSWFKGSVITNPDGSPKRVYHGTGADIQHFSYDFTNTGADQHGSGFYFTDSAEVASGYASKRNPNDEPKPGGEQGNVLAVYLNIKKPIHVMDAQSTVREKCMNAAQVKKVILASPVLEDALMNWGDVESEGRNAVLNTAVPVYTDDENLLKQLFKLANDFFPHHVEAFNTIVHKVTGYDGVDVDFGQEHHYIAWFPTQIRSAVSGADFIKASKLLTRQANGVLDFSQAAEWHDLFYGSPDPKRLKELNQFLKRNPEQIIRLYHGTDASLPIMTEGLLPTSTKRRRSLQSGSGHVYLSVYEGMAETFGTMGNPGKKIEVYAVQLPARMLSPDPDQLRNKRYWGEDKEIGSTLADSLVIGKGARVKGTVMSWAIRPLRGAWDPNWSKSGWELPEKTASSVDASDIPKITDWSGAVKGPYLESVRILRERRRKR
jgi:ParB-like chromosome segregation protein Spo0J/GNAT superfamily N-acetyltransferase